MKKKNKLDSLILTAGRVVQSLKYQSRSQIHLPGLCPLMF